jgi:hypothetical protein
VPRFPIPAGYEETEAFIERSRAHVDGWISFHWGKTIEEDEKAGTPAGPWPAAGCDAFEPSPYPPDGEKK